MLKKLKEKFKNISNKKKIYGILIIVFILMLVLNYLTPLLADDYSYIKMRNSLPINNFYDIIINQINHYFNWGGRTIAHTIAQVFLALIGKNIFNIFNSLVYVFLVYLIYKIAKPKNEDKPFLLIIIHLLLWFILPVFGQTCLWLVGSCNYLWTTMIILIFLNFYKNLENKKDSLIKIVFMFLLGIIAAWTNENTSFGLLIIIFGILGVFKISNKKMKLPKWSVSGLIGAIIGFLILILAPGNFIRNNAFIDEETLVIKLIKRILEATTSIPKYILPLIIISIILITILVYYKKKIKSTNWVYFIGAFFTIYSMVLSPTFPSRAWFGVIIFMIIPIINLLFETINLHKLLKYLTIDTCIVYSIIFVTSYIDAFTDILNLKVTWDSRIEFIEYQKSLGILDIELESFYTENKYNPNFELVDLGENTTDWPNGDVAIYFKINSIKRIRN